MTSEDLTRLVADSQHVAINPALLGVDESAEGPDARAEQLRHFELLAGTLWHASVTLVDKLFDDLAVLQQQPDGTVAETDVLSRLPERFWRQITPRFARQFIAVSLDLTGRVTSGWSPLGCVAQELALRCLIDEMEVISETYEVPLPQYWRPDLEDMLFEDLDHELLYAHALDGFENDPQFGPPGMVPMAFDQWFAPFNHDRRLPPFVED